MTTENTARPQLRAYGTITNIGEETAYKVTIHIRTWFSNGTQAIVLDEPLSTAPSGEPARLFQTGIHHFSFWVDDIAAIVARARAAGLDVLFEPGVGDTLAYGEAPGGKVLSTFVRDPDGNNMVLFKRRSGVLFRASAGRQRRRPRGDLGG